MRKKIASIQATLEAQLHAAPAYAPVVEKVADNAPRADCNPYMELAEVVNEMGIYPAYNCLINAIEKLTPDVIVPTPCQGNEKEKKEEYERNGILSLLMIGARISKTENCKTNNNSNPFDNENSSYHRLDSLDNWPIYLKVLKLLKNEDDPNFSKHIYIPFTLVEYSEETINDYLLNLKEDENELERSFFTHEIVKFDDETANIAIIKISYAGQDTTIKYQYKYNAKNIVGATGLTASLWQIARMYSRHYLELPEKNLSFPVDAKESDYQNKIDEFYKKNQVHLPRNIASLKNSEIIQKLKEIADCTEKPTHILANCLSKLIDGLPDHDIEQKEIIIIYMFLRISELHTYDYKRFANILYVICHEISLILNRHVDNETPVISYENFIDNILNYSIPYLGLNKEEPNESKKEYAVIAHPANSGCHAFTTCLQIAHDAVLQDGKAPSIKTIGPNYYELSQLYTESECVDADIYIISTGAITDHTGSRSGTNLNKLIQDRILVKKPEQRKHITIIIDTTTGLYFDLRLNEEAINLLEDGLLTILIHESGVKFMDAHIDQAQFGRMYGVLSRKVYGSEYTTTIQTSAEKSLMNTDAQIGAYLPNCYKNLTELIKAKTVVNANLFGKVIQEHGVFYPDQLDPNNDAGFVLGPHETGDYYEDRTKAYNVVSDFFTRRSGFGHFEWTMSLIINKYGEGVYRLSPNGSDNIDTLIEAAALLYSYITYDMNDYEQWDVKEELFSKIDNPGAPLAKRILAIGALLSTWKIKENIDFKICFPILKILEKLFNSNATLSKRHRSIDLLNFYCKVKKQLAEYLAVYNLDADKYCLALDYLIGMGIKINLNIMYYFIETAEPKKQIETFPIESTDDSQTNESKPEKYGKQRKPNTEKSMIDYIVSNKLTSALVMKFIFPEQMLCVILLKIRKLNIILNNAQGIDGGYKSKLTLFSIAESSISKNAEPDTYDSDSDYN